MKNKEIEVLEAYKLFNTLVNKGIIKFKFHDNNLVPLEPIKIVHNKTNNTIDIEFRNVVQEHLNELKEVLNKIENEKKNSC